METNTRRLHPLLTAAAISVTVFSAVGVAAVTGLIRLGTEAGIEIAWFRLWGYPAVDLILAGMLGVVLMAGGGPFAQPALVYLGRISYGLYVFHLMVIALVLLHFRLWPVQLTLSFGLTLGLAALSYALLERPFLRLKARFTYIRSAPV